MANYKVLKDFFYGPDGKDVFLYSSGDTQEVNDDLSVGLLAEQFIAVLGVVPPNKLKG
jgi:hypothetical protein